MKGIQKIKWSGKGKIDVSKSKPNVTLAVLPKNDIGFVVDKWLNGTTEEDKKKNVTWILQDKNRKEISRIQKRPKEEFTLNIPNALCGPYTYYLEASLSGIIDRKNKTGLWVTGICTPRVINSKWSTTVDGADVRKKIQFKYGQLIYLSLETEGLNGSTSLTVEVYKFIEGSYITGREKDKLVATFTNVAVIDGEVNLKIGNTASWFVHAKKDEEQFYVKVKTNWGSYVSDGKDTIHARFLRIKKKQVTKAVGPSTNNTPLKIGDAEKNFLSYISCKYSAISIISGGTTKTIFDGKSKKLVNINYPIISSDFDDHKETIIIDLKDIKTSQCINSGNSNSHFNNTIKIMNKPENFIIKNKTDGKLEIQTGFKYHPSNDNLAEKTSFNILEYIFPASLPDDNNKPLQIKTNTCGYSNNIEITIYPDVKWTLDFKLGMKGPKQLSHTNMPTYDRRSDEQIEDKPNEVNSRYSSNQKKALNASKINKNGTIKRGNGMELDFQLSLKAEYNKGEEFELAEKYANKIQKGLNILLMIKEKLDILTNIDKINKGHKSAVKSLGSKIKVFKSPIIGTLDYPAISFGGKWKAGVDEATNKVYTDGKLFLRFNPLLKGDISLDIIAAASYVPAFGQAIKAIEIALNTAGAELNFLLTLFGQVNVEGEYALAKKGGSNLNGNGEIGIKLVLSGKMKISYNLIIFKSGKDDNIQAEGSFVSSFKPKLSIGHDSEGTYLEGKCDFMGINLIVIVSMTLRNSVTQYKDTFNILEREDDFIKGKGYIIT